MKLVKFTKDVPSHSAFCGEVMGFADEDADRLVKVGKAIYAPALAPAATAEPEPFDEPAADADDESAADGDDDKPKKRGPGRPRKAD